MSFLKAEWRKLILANYIVEPQILEKYIPFGTELDLWKDKCYVSLVGFMFRNTKLLGFKIPFHVNFEEVNLRFYVKRLDEGKWKRGVVFVKEIVPKSALTFVANTVYNENYETLPMSHVWKEDKVNRTVAYSWKKDENWNRIEVLASAASYEIKDGSEDEFVTEHYWGYAHVNEHKSNEYEVTHPKWKVYKVNQYDIDIDFGSVYGPEFQFLDNVEPFSLMLAEGSEITVEGKNVIK